MTKPPLITRLPRGLRDQPAWVFIGSLLFLVGLTYLTGFTESVISKAIGDMGLRVWGGILMTCGGGLVWATVASRPALEKLALRATSLTLVAYTGYLLTVTDFQRAAMTVVLSVLLIGLAEFRVLTLTALIRQSEEFRQVMEVDPGE